MNIRQAIILYPRMEEELERLHKKLTKLNSEMIDYNNIKASIITDMPRGSGTSNPTLDYIIKFRYENEQEMGKIAQEMNEIRVWKKRLDKNIKRLSETEKLFVESAQEYWGNDDNIKKMRDKVKIAEPTYYSIKKRVLEKLGA